jgi:hypothetical protein
VLEDKRDNFNDVPWQQGRMLWTATTRRMGAAFHREAQEREARSLFAHFSEQDEGRSRVLLWHFDTAEDCAAAVEKHNRELAKRGMTPTPETAMPKKLNAGEKNFLRLIAKGQQLNGGWAKVSKQLYPLVRAMPPELVEHFAHEDGGGRAQLTPQGEAVLDAMEWL